MPLSDEPRCPRCGETRQIEIEGFTAFCNVCAKSWALPKVDVPVNGN